MRKPTATFIVRDKDESGIVSMTSKFSLSPYKHPGYVALDKWSAMKRREFQVMYGEFTDELLAARKSSAQGTRLALAKVQEAAAKYLDEDDPDTGKVYCAVPLNHVLWLAMLDKDADSARTLADNAALLLRSAIKKGYDKVRCPALADWPVSRRCLEIIRGKGRYDVCPPAMLQGLMTAWACTLGERQGLSGRQANEHGLTWEDRQDRARRLFGAVLGEISPMYQMIRHLFEAGTSDEGKVPGNVLFRAPVMPVATGLSRTLVMAAMPVAAAMQLLFWPIARAWPVVEQKVPVAESTKKMAQLLAGMCCTMSGHSTLDALDKTCYVWTRYLW